MKISKNSWHYRLVNAFGTKNAKERFYLGCHTTCSYIRAILWSFVPATLALFGMLAATFIAGLLITGMVIAPVQLFLGIVGVKGEWSAHFYFLGTVGWGAIAVVLSTWAVVSGFAKISSRRPTMREKAELIKQAYADKKDGVCTLIEVE